jgi:hypothetical protein
MNAPPTLEEIIKFDAEFVGDISITLSRTFETVCIKDDTGEQDDIFMQGHEAANFIEQLDKLAEDAPNVLLSDAIKHLAKPYIECIWS